MQFIMDGCEEVVLVSRSSDKMVLMLTSTLDNSSAHPREGGEGRENTKGEGGEGRERKFFKTSWGGRKHLIRSSRLMPLHTRMY